MHGSSDFLSPGRHEYDNVRALNAAWLQATTDMKGPQRGRMASIPFLIFSIREQDLDWWQVALAGGQQRDLLVNVTECSLELAALQAAALGFLWQLLQTNPYAARVISGASVAWCDKLAILPLVSVLEKVAWRSDLTSPRVQFVEPRSGLAQCVTSSREAIRNASRQLALQGLLTNARSNEYAALTAAACAMPHALRVADQRPEHRPEHRPTLRKKV